MRGASFTVDLSNGTTMRSPPTSARCSGMNDCLVPNSPVFTASHSGSPFSASRYTSSVEPILPPSAS